MTTLNRNALRGVARLDRMGRNTYSPNRRYLCDTLPLEPCIYMIPER